MTESCPLNELSTLENGYNLEKGDKTFDITKIKIAKDVTILLFTEAIPYDQAAQAMVWVP